MLTELGRALSKAGISPDDYLNGVKSPFGHAHHSIKQAPLAPEAAHLQPKLRLGGSVSAGPCFAKEPHALPEKRSTAHLKARVKPIKLAGL